MRTRTFSRLAAFVLIAAVMGGSAAALAQTTTPSTSTTTDTGTGGTSTSTPNTGATATSTTGTSGTATTTGTGTSGTGTTGTATTTGTGVSTPSYPPSILTPGLAPTVLNVQNSGAAIIRGVVQSAGTSTIMIYSWGGLWTVRTTPMSVVIASGIRAPHDMSGIRVGDFVGVQGLIAADQNFTVNAALVRDWTTNPFTGTTTTSASGAAGIQPAGSGTNDGPAGGTNTNGTQNGTGGTGTGTTGTGGSSTGGTNTGTGGTNQNNTGT